MAVVYILYSVQLGKYYIGSCLNLSERLFEHTLKKYEDSFTAKADDWILFYSISNLEYNQARLIEAHIKRMKSKKYIENLKKYSDISKRLVEVHH